MVTKQKPSQTVGKILYGALFALLLPTLLIIWSIHLDQLINWATPPMMPIVLLVTIAAGATLISKGIYDLYFYGRGLPMNAYPPKRLVTEGIYSWFANPIYVGSVLLCFGGAIYYQSGTALYIVTPLLAAMALSLLVGYERQAMARIFSSSFATYRPLFALPSNAENDTTTSKRIAMIARVFAPWLITLYLINYNLDSLTTSAGRLYFVGLLWPLPFTYILFKLATAKTSADLLQATLSGTIATAASVYIAILWPASTLIVQFVISLVIVIAAVNYLHIWAFLQHVTEWVANSRRDLVLANGRFRIISHAYYSAVGGIIAIAIAAYIVGNNGAVLLFGVIALAGAAVFARVLWGSAALARPFGYWGGILGGIIGTVVLYLLFDISPALVAVVAVLAAPFAQAAGRLRCLSQGCCHGIPTKNKLLGIRVWQPQSRVVMLSELKGVYLLNTQLYSILFNILLGLFLWRMWFYHIC